MNIISKHVWCSVGDDIVLIVISEDMTKPDFQLKCAYKYDQFTSRYVVVLYNFDESFVKIINGTINNYIEDYFFKNYENPKSDEVLRIAYAPSYIQLKNVKTIGISPIVLTGEFIEEILNFALNSTVDRETEINNVISKYHHQKLDHQESIPVTQVPEMEDQEQMHHTSE